MTILLHFAHRGAERLGAVETFDATTVVDLNLTYWHLLQTRAVPSPTLAADAALSPDPLTYLQAGEVALTATKDALAHVATLPTEQARQAGLVLDRSEVETLVPIANPPKIVCVARNYGKHAQEAGRPLSEIPILFPRFAATLVPNGASVEVPRVSHEVDWEGELAVVIGTGGRHITKADAMSHVAGYTIFNDVSVRDYQFRVSQYTGGKNFATSGPIGPYLVLADAGLDPHDLQITTTLNGEVMQDAPTSEMVFDIPTIIEHISEFIALEPGDIIPMGTPAGVGFSRKPPIFLRAGDTISVEVAGLGVLTNPVVAEKA